MLTFEEWVLGGNPLQQSGSGLELDPELNWEFGPVANTSNSRCRRLVLYNGERLEYLPE
jgi:hypothetical protein